MSKPKPPIVSDVGFEECLNKVYDLIRSGAWQERYQRGYLLILAQDAFRCRSQPSAFIHCWTIWEHLFTLLNQKWMSEEQMRKISATEKISFLMVEYALKDRITKVSRERIGSLTKLRNRVVHFGRFPEGFGEEDVTLFFHMTEFIIAKALGLLKPSEVFDTTIKLGKFLDEKDPKPIPFPRDDPTVKGN